MVDRDNILSRFIVCNYRNAIVLSIFNGITDFKDKHGIATFMFSNVISVDKQLRNGTYPFKLQKGPSLLNAFSRMESFLIESLPFQEVPTLLQICLIQTL